MLPLYRESCPWPAWRWPNRTTVTLTKTRSSSTVRWPEKCGKLLSASQEKQNLAFITALSAAVGPMFERLQVVCSHQQDLQDWVEHLSRQIKHTAATAPSHKPLTVPCHTVRIWSSSRRHTDHFPSAALWTLWFKHCVYSFIFHWKQTQTVSSIYLKKLLCFWMKWPHSASTFVEINRIVWVELWMQGLNISKNVLLNNIDIVQVHLTFDRSVFPGKPNNIF